MQVPNPPIICFKPACTGKCSGGENALQRSLYTEGAIARYVANGATAWDVVGVGSGSVRTEVVSIGRSAVVENIAIGGLSVLLNYG
ncbi:hypothetical protein B9Z19DRAFT_1131744 [Tuber borchii]|uniref:Uncharacterized protein n=1 Tax=Tuber borchii TaxID=42251 RepID=A0A2T6ZIH8_TUBBO|nr:hypothetical protein B9Z19DRAFT_1131744 [Tuber borchii]